MTFFTPDLYRRIGLGFAVGAVLVAAASADSWAEQISPPAQAAEVPQAPEPAPEFLIQPLD
ncbi:MAG: hypothetical protein AAF559_02570 [Pseudomonadota bacterium]